MQLEPAIKNAVIFEAVLEDRGFSVRNIDGIKMAEKGPPAE